jgi:hypothetical protein
MFPLVAGYDSSLERSARNGGTGTLARLGARNF